MKRAYNEYDIMKVLLLVLVVVAHVTRMYTPVGAIPVYGCNEWLSVMTDYIYSFHMPAFIAVSGMTFSMSMRKLESNDYSKMGGVKSKLRRLMIPYVFFSIVVVLPTMLYTGCANIDDGIIEYIFKSYVLALDSSHLWYVYTLFELSVFFMLSYTFVNRYPVITLCALLGLFACSYLLPRVFLLNTFCHYAIFFFFGNIMIRQHEFLEKFKDMRVVLCLFVISIMLMYAKGHLPQTAVKLIAGLNGILMVYGVSCHLFKVGMVKYDLFQKVCKNSYGMYLFHPMIIYLLYYCALPYEINSWALSMTVFVITFFVSYGATTVVRRSGWRFVIGEK